MAVLAQKHPLEGLPKHVVEDGVEDGIDHGAGVAQPGGQVEHGFVDVALAVRAAKVQHKERRPHDHECEEDHSEDLGGFLLEPDDPAVARRRPGHDARRPGVVAPHGRGAQGARRPGRRARAARQGGEVARRAAPHRGSAPEQRCSTRRPQGADARRRQVAPQTARGAALLPGDDDGAGGAGRARARPGGGVGPVGRQARGPPLGGLAEVGARARRGQLQGWGRLGPPEGRSRRRH